MGPRQVTSTHHVVVGAGAAGCVLAARLSEDPSVGVTLLEAGPRARALATRIPAAFSQLFKGDLDWAYETEPQPALNDRRLFWPRGRAVGGSTVMNAQMWVRGPRADYDGWADAGCTGWGWDDVAETYRSIEAAGRGPAPWRGTFGRLSIQDLRDPNPMTLAFLEAATEAGIPRTADVNDPDHQDGVDSTQVIQRRGRRHSVADAYLAPARRRRNLTVVTGARATRVLVEDGRAVGVTYRRGDAEQVVRADGEVILCGGAVNTPQLLLCSGIGPAGHLAGHGIACIADVPAVGGQLQDHLSVVTVALSPAGEDGSLLAAEGAAQLLAWATRGRGMLTSNVGEALAFIRTDASAPAADVELIFAPVPYLDHGLTEPPGHGFTVGAILLQPRSRGTIRLASADPLAAPVIEPAYLSDPDGQDLATLTAGVRRAYDVLHRPALARYLERDLRPDHAPVDDADWHRHIRTYAETLYHPVGTARMGAADDPDAVVGPDLRVHGVEGLRVADASVMPTITRGHTQAPTMLIAERAAALLRRAAATTAAGGPVFSC